MLLTFAIMVFTFQDVTVQLGKKVHQGLKIYSVSPSEPGQDERTDQPHIFVSKSISVNTEADANNPGETTHPEFLTPEKRERKQQAKAASILTVCSDGCAYFSLQDALVAASSGDTISLGAGTFAEIGQILIDKDLTITGISAKITTIVATGPTSTSGDRRGWFLVSPGTNLNLRDLRLDGSGFPIWQGIRHLGSGLIERVSFENIGYNQSGPEFQGTAVAVFGMGAVNVRSCTFAQIGREGVFFFGAGVTNSSFENNRYTGKGEGNWLDYALELGGGAVVHQINGNTITENRGVTTTGFGSAGILISTFFGDGTEATLTDNSITHNKTGLIVGINSRDTSVVTATSNRFSANTQAVYSSITQVDAGYSWWGDSSGPTHADNTGGLGDPISDHVTYSPYLDMPVTWTVCPDGCDFTMLQSALASATSGDTISMGPGIYPEVGQIVIDKSLTIVGAGKTNTTILATESTTSSGDGRGWFLVTPGTFLNLGDLSLDGGGHLIWQGIRHRGRGLIERVDFREIKYNESGPDYQGTAVAAFGDGAVDIQACSFSQIGREGVFYFGAGVSGSVFEKNSYTGKGLGDWLDYAIEAGGGAVVAQISGNFINANLGTSSVGDHNSSGILVSTFYGAGSAATIIGNDISGNTTGITVGVNNTDTSSVSAHDNSITGNLLGIYSSAQPVNATDNWWGMDNGPYHPIDNPAGLGDPVSDFVTFAPFISGTADLALDLMVLADQTTAGDMLSFSITVSNLSTGDATTTLLSLSLPDGVTLQEAQPTQGSCPSATCDLGAIAAGASAGVQVTVLTDSALTGNFQVMATCSSDTVDPDLTNNSVTKTTILTPVSSTVASNVSMGEGVEIGENVDVKTGTEIGNQVTIDNQTKVFPNVTIGDNVTIGSNVEIKQGTIIGANTVIADYVTIMAGTTIGSDVSVGNNATIRTNSTVPNDTNIQSETTWPIR